MPLPECLPLASSHAFSPRPPPAPSEHQLSSFSAHRPGSAPSSCLFDHGFERYPLPSRSKQELASPGVLSGRLLFPASRLDYSLESSHVRSPFDAASSTGSDFLGSPVVIIHGKKLRRASFVKGRGRAARFRCRSQLSGSTESEISSPDAAKPFVWEKEFFADHADHSSSWDGNPLSLDGSFSSTAVPYSYVEEEELLGSDRAYVHVVRRTRRKKQLWKSLFRSLKAKLNGVLTDEKQYTLVSKNFTKVFVPSRRRKSSPVSVPFFSQIRRSKAEMSAWFHHMGGNYGTPLLLSLVVGYWIQGFRSFPWLAVFYHLKDGLQVDPGTLQFIQCTTNLPMVAKPIYGIISDAVYIGGARRMPYLMIAGALQMSSWGIAALHSGARSSIGGMIGVLAVSNIGAAIAEVVNDALVAESGQKERGRSKGELQSFMWLALACGGVLGNLTGGFALSKLSANSMFAVFTTLVAVQLVACALVKEQSFGFKVTRQEKIPEEEKVSIAEIVSKQAKKLFALVSRPEVFLPLVWFASSYAVIPAMGGSLFFFQTQYLKINPASLGLAKVVGQVGLFVASLLYNRYLKKAPPRKILMWTQILLSFCMLSDLLLVLRLNIRVGVPDRVFVLGASAFVEAIGQFKILPVMVLLTQLCPAGSEASLLAFSMSCHCLASIVSGYLGVGLASALHLSAISFTGLPLGLILQSVFALTPLLWLSFIPGECKKFRTAVAVS